MPPQRLNLSGRIPDETSLWRELIQFGGSLLDLPTISEFYPKIIEFIEKTLNCKALLWLDEQRLQPDEVITDSPDISSTGVNAELMEYVISNHAPFRITQRGITQIAYPLVIKDELIGILQIERNSDSPFSNKELHLALGIIYQLEITLHIRMKQEQYRWNIKRLSTLAELSKAISSILDIDNLLNNVVTLIHNKFGYYQVMIFTVQHGHDSVQFRAGVGNNGLIQQFEELPTSDIQQRNPIYLAIQDGKSLVVRRESNPEHLSQVPHYELAIPLVFGEQILGVLYIQCNRLAPFGDDEISLLEALAESIAVAIRNANLYRSEQWRRQVADSMREIAGMISAEVALSQVLDRILIELERVLPCDMSAIWLLEDRESEDGTGLYTSPLRLASAHLGSDVSAITGNAALVEELIGSYELNPSDSPWVFQALTSSQPLIRLAEMPYEPLGALFSFPSEYSAIAAPLRIGEVSLGVLILIHHDTSRYGGESRAMTSAFASYASVAIQNTRLYEAAHDQAWISTVLLQVAEATQSVVSLDDLLSTVSHIIPKIIGVTACVVLLWDDEIETFTPASSYGFDEGKLENINLWEFHRGVVPAFDELIEEKTPIIMESELIPQYIQQTIFSSFDFSKELLVVFPMTTQDALLGAVVVDFGSPHMNSLGSNERWDEKFTIIQGIAHQTAIAVENIRLIASREEEAYISIALLQVAQAVVSLGKLEEILEAIVRITPILVGTKRCIIFLWDQVKQEYHLSRYYGISRSEIGLLKQTYFPSEFPFLETIRQHNRLVYHYLSPNSDDFQPWNLILEDYFLYENDIGGGTIPSENPQEFLLARNRMLLGFPISVKGKVFGMMLTEEEDNVKGPPSYHTRKKRMEIIVGITQHAALAIQNDIFQKEMVERERLERELSLAREIQKVFLPERIPKLEGWDLDIRWRPARQVSVDFYDIFNLPCGKVGIVIADVADKGIPAALFMTVIRTLIRSAARDEISPAKVLKKVNDLIVPDAKGGMFITVAYLVITLKSGLIVYANAGHNPPLIKRRISTRLEEMRRTGIALGVFEGIEIEDRVKKLKSGDILLMYTDGVSEAISSSGELFGIKRLRRVVLSSYLFVANELLENIEHSLDLFTQGEPRSDDMTLVALVRELPQ